MAEFLRWVEEFNKESFVTEQASAIKQLESDMFTKQRIDHISYADDLPEKMSKEMYIRIFSKIWATIRHDLWKELQEYKKE